MLLAAAATACGPAGRVAVPAPAATAGSGARRLSARSPAPPPAGSARPAASAPSLLKLLTPRHPHSGIEAIQYPVIGANCD